MQSRPAGNASARACHQGRPRRVAPERGAAEDCGSASCRWLRALCARTRLSRRPVQEDESDQQQHDSQPRRRRARARGRVRGERRRRALRAAGRIHDRPSPGSRTSCTRWACPAGPPSRARACPDRTPVPGELVVRSAMLAGPREAPRGRSGPLACRRSTRRKSPRSSEPRVNREGGRGGHPRRPVTPVRRPRAARRAWARP